MKKFLSVFLCLLMLVPFSVIGLAAENDEEYIVVESRPDYYDAIYVPEEIDTEVDWDALFACIQQGITNHDESITVSQFNVTIDTANMEYISNYLYNSPAILGIVQGYSYGYYPNSFSNKLTRISPNYGFSAEEYSERYAACVSRIDTILDGIRDNDNLTDVEKVLLVHDRLDTWNEYDYANLLAGSVPSESHSAYGALALGVSVCQGYALAFDWMMDELGIPCYYVSSSALNHAWNIVTIGGEKYQLDATWDDPVWDLYGRANHINFLQSTEKFSVKHNATDYDDSPVDTTYDDYYWTDSNAEFQLIDGVLYYLNSTDGVIYKRVNGESVAVYTITARWMASTTGYWTGKFSGLSSYNGKLVFNTTDTVYALDVDTLETEVLYTDTEDDTIDASSYTHIYGSTIQDNTLYLDVNSSPNFSSTTRENRIVYRLPCAHATITVKSDTAASCTEDGALVEVCTVCGEEFTTTRPSTGHTEETIAAISATCTEKGATEGKKCTVCGVVTVTPAEIPANGHSYDAVVTAPTCTSAGYTTYTCKVCGDNYVGDETAKAAHTEVTIPAVAATCTSTGLTEGKKCSVCGVTTVTQTEIPMLSHTSDGGVVTKAATCTEKGVKTYTCTVCKAVISTEEIDKLNHSYNTVVTNPTCTAKGYTTYTCKVCGDTYTADETDMIAHTTYISKAEVPATCTVDGRTAEVKCSVCGQTVTASTRIPATSHAYKSATTKPTCTEKGYITFTCAKCGYSYNDNYKNGGGPVLHKTA